MLHKDEVVSNDIGPNGIGQRIRAAREQRKISQAKLAEALGWKHHQIVCDLEQGKREIKAHELYEIAKFLHVDFNTLLGSKEPAYEPYVLWRQKPPQNEKILEAQFLKQCNRYVWLEKILGGTTEQPAVFFEEVPKRNIQLSSFTLEQAYQLAEAIRQHMNLGDFPASQLVNVLEERYGIKFLIDGNTIKSPAACSRSDKGCFILLNGQDVEGRQYFSIAHELFHLITWDEKMLQLVDTKPQLHEKNEQFANAFAAGLLVPKEKLQIEAARICSHQPISAADVVALAEQFQVSKEAMLYRMFNVNLIANKPFNELKEQLQKLSCSKAVSQNISLTLKSKFVRLVYLAYEHIKISRSKAAELLDIDLCDLSSFFNSYGFIEINAL